MSDFLLPRDRRKRKREIYARAHKSFVDLVESMRDMREFVEDVKPLYDHLGDKAWPDDRALDSLLVKLKRLELRQGDMDVQDLLAVFNNVREEI